MPRSLHGLTCGDIMVVLHTGKDGDWRSAVACLQPQQSQAMKQTWGSSGEVPGLKQGCLLQGHESTQAGSVTGA